MSERLIKTVRCVHFNGVQNDRCRAGVLYDDVRVTPTDAVQTGHRFALPCFQGDGAGECSSCRYPTEEELDARDRELRERFEHMGEARRRIRQDAGLAGRKPTHDIRATVECPKCGKRLVYSVASYNGHIWGNCETPDCLSWME